MPDDLRPETVEALTTTPPLPAALVVQVLDATDAEREAAAAQLLDETRQFLTDAGVLRPSVSVMDMSYRTAISIVAAVGTVLGVWSQPSYQTRSLGDVVKVVRTEEAEWAVAMLRWGGLLPPEERGGA